MGNETREPRQHIPQRGKGMRVGTFAVMASEPRALLRVNAGSSAEYTKKIPATLSSLPASKASGGAPPTFTTTRLTRAVCTGIVGTLG